MSLPSAGVCRYCGCTDHDACTLPDGDPCAWADPTHTVCTNPECLEMARKEAAA